MQDSQETGETQKRLNNTGHIYFLGVPYFAETQIAQIFWLPMDQRNLKKEVDKLWNGNLTRQYKDEICATHDLSPAVEATFRMDRISLKEVLTDAKVKEFWT